MTLTGYVQPDQRERFSLTRYLPGPAAVNYAVYTETDGTITLVPADAGAAVTPMRKPDVA